MAETVRGLNIKLTLDAKDLQNELTNIKANLKEQQKDLKAINTSLRYDSTNLDLWKKKQETLLETFDEMMWGSLLESVVVYKDNVLFKFRDGTEIKG